MGVADQVPADPDLGVAGVAGDAVVQGQEPEPAIPQTAANSDEPAVVDDMSDSEVDALLKELTAGE